MGADPDVVEVEDGVGREAVGEVDVDGEGPVVGRGGTADVGVDPGVEIVGDEVPYG